MRGGSKLILAYERAKHRRRKRLLTVYVYTNQKIK